MYVGREYVYSFHADSPIKVMELASSLAATLAQQRDRLQAQQAAPVFASVIGSLSGLNMLSKAQLRDPSHVILYDMNPWMLDYARLIVELIRMSSSPEEYLSRLLSRPVQTSFVASNASAILPLTEQQRIQQSFLSLPPDSSLMQDTTHALTPRSACVFRWLCETIVTVPQPLEPPAAPRSVCERVELFHNPARSPRLDVELVHS